MAPWTLQATQAIRAVTGGTLRPGGFALTERALAFCALPEDGRILDAGCAVGATAQYLADRHGAPALGVDLSWSFLAEARARHGALPLVRARIERLPFVDAAFDGIVCECVLSHVPAEPVLGAFSRVLRPGGFLILSDLYRRRGSGAAGVARPAGTGPMERERLIALVEAAAFRLVHWEDRTADLRQLAFRMIMERDSLREMLLLTGQSSCVEGFFGAWSDLGYYLLVAGRRGR